MGWERTLTWLVTIICFPSYYYLYSASQETECDSLFRGLKLLKLSRTGIICSLAIKSTKSKFKCRQYAQRRHEMQKLAGTDRFLQPDFWEGYTNIKVGR